MELAEESARRTEIDLPADNELQLVAHRIAHLRLHRTTAMAKPRGTADLHLKGLVEEPVDRVDRKAVHIASILICRQIILRHQKAQEWVGDRSWISKAIVVPI